MSGKNAINVSYCLNESRTTILNKGFYFYLSEHGILVQPRRFYTIWLNITLAL